MRIGIGHVFTEDADPFVDRHLLVQGEADRLAERDHVAGRGVGRSVVHLRSRLSRVGENRGRSEHVIQNRSGIGPRQGECRLGRRTHGLLGFRTHLFGGFLGERAGRDQSLLENRDRVVLALVVELLGRAVLLLVVGKRVRVRAGHQRMHETRSRARTNVRDRVRPLAADLEVVAAVHLHDVEAADAADHLGDRCRCLIG